MKSLFGGSAAIAAALLTASTLFYPRPLAARSADAISQHIQQEKPDSAAPTQEPKTGMPLPTSLPDTLHAPRTPPEASLDSAPVTDKIGTSTSAPAMSPAPKAEIAPAAPVTSPQSYIATAYSLPGRTASGRPVAKGIIAADTRVLPMGTRVRLDAGPYSGEYVVADAGSAVKGRKIDVWVPTYREACRFGRRNVKLTVLSYGAKKKARGRK
jgi:3D (Asp-Asp-Asp) domain-containing protein